ncbi:MAG: LCP family protein [Candidatus Dormibacteria bacterium]
MSRPTPPPSKLAPSLVARRRRRRRPRLAWALVFVVGLMLSGGVGAGAYFLPLATTAASSTGRISGASAQGALSSPPASGDPFTVLLLGSDDDSKFDTGAVLTQSMILVRVVPATHKVVMLSIPRDLWVPLSTGGMGKIDQAYLHGGASAAIRTVESNFHVRVDHYAWIGLQGLVKLIDVVGGVDVVASNPVLDDYYPADIGGDPYAYMRVAVLPGAQHMDGVTALEYVRSRHDDLRSDFGRSVRQQQVLVALRDKARAIGAGDLPLLAGALQGYLATDMDIPTAASLLPLAREFTPSDVTRELLLPPYTSDADVGGQSVLEGDWATIRTLVSRDFPA